MRRITDEERRARLITRHRLVGPADAVEAVADDLVVLHATDPATVYLSSWARLASATVADIDAALYERRTMLRTLAMRRTLFVATADRLPIVERSSSIDVAAVERKRLVKFITESGIARPERWLDQVFALVLAALDEVDVDRSGLAARQLTAAVPQLGTKLVMGAGTRHAVEAGATSRVLGLMAVEGLLARGRPAGNWTGRQYRWHRRDRWLDVGEPPIDPEQAAGELVRQWLARFGPGTLTDIKWWTGWTVTKTRRALATVETVDVELADGAGYVLAGDDEPEAAPGPSVALLPSLDPTPMGWKERAWYLGEHRAELFDRNGNIGPTVWTDGRIVGGWGQRPDGEVVIELLEDIGGEHRAMIDREVERLALFVGDVAVKPSFPTPLQRRLAT